MGRGKQGVGPAYSEPLIQVGYLDQEVGLWEALEEGFLTWMNSEHPRNPETVGCRG